MFDEYYSETMREQMFRDAVTISVLDEVHYERISQDDKWGQQDHPMGTHTAYANRADELKKLNDHLAKTGGITWRDVLLEEVYEALAEIDPVKLRAELVQVAAVAVAIVENIDRNSS